MFRYNDGRLAHNTLTAQTGSRLLPDTLKHRLLMSDKRHLMPSDPSAASAFWARSRAGREAGPPGADQQMRKFFLFFALFYRLYSIFSYI